MYTMFFDFARYVQEIVQFYIIRYSTSLMEKPMYFIKEEYSSFINSKRVYYVQTVTDSSM